MLVVYQLRERYIFYLMVDGRKDGKFLFQLMENLFSLPMPHLVVMIWIQELVMN